MQSAGSLIEKPVQRCSERADDGANRLSHRSNFFSNEGLHASLPLSVGGTERVSGAIRPYWSENLYTTLSSVHYDVNLHYLTNVEHTILKTTSYIFLKNIISKNYNWSYYPLYIIWKQKNFKLKNTTSSYSTSKIIWTHEFPLLDFCLTFSFYAKWEVRDRRCIGCTNARQTWCNAGKMCMRCVQTMRRSMNAHGMCFAVLRPTASRRCCFTRHCFVASWRCAVSLKLLHTGAWINTSVLFHVCEMFRDGALLHTGSLLHASKLFRSGAWLGVRALLRPVLAPHQDTTAYRMQVCVSRTYTLLNLGSIHFMQNVNTLNYRLDT